MGNCLNLMCFHSMLPSSFQPSSGKASSPCIASSMKRLSTAGEAGSVGALTASPSNKHCAHTCFAPILPFSTSSDLGTLYSLGPELGRGQFGIIRRCTSRSSGALFACKSISKLRLRTIHAVKDIVCEVTIMKHLSNRKPPQGCPQGNVVRLHEVIEDASFVHLIMELCSGGELFDKIVKKKWYSEAEAAFLMKSILETLQFCHSVGIMHRDLKPENILLVDNSDASEIKLADFGLAVQFFPGQKFTGMVGSAYYIAPEVLRGEYSAEIDVWSAGVIMYVLLSGVPPFWGETDYGILKAIREGVLDFTSEPWDTISSPAKDLIRQFLCVDVKLRWTPAQALNHPWIIQHTGRVVEQRPGASMSNNALQSNSKGLILPIVDLSQGHINDRSVPIAPTLLVDLTDSSMVHSRKVKPDLTLLLTDLVVLILDSKTPSLSESLPQLKLQSGWTCSLLTVSATEETMLVDMGQDKYLILHDKKRQRIGWKPMQQQWLRRRDE